MERWRKEGGEDERMQEEGEMMRCKTKCKVGGVQEQTQGGSGGRDGRRKEAKEATEGDREG